MNIKPQKTLAREQVEFVMTLYSKGHMQEAINEIKSLNEKYPNVPLLFNLMGACYKSLSDIDAAVQMFKTATKIKPDYAEAHFNLGVILKDLGKLKEAVDCFQRSIAIQPNYPDAHNNLGNALVDLDQREAAIESYEWAVAYKPDYTQAYLNLAILFSKFNPIKAVDYYKKAIIIDSNYDAAYFNLASTYRHLGLKDEAIAAYEKAIEIKPDYADAHKNLSAMKKYNKNDSQILQMELLLSKNDLNESDQISLNFALAKVNEDLGNEDDFFKFLNKGNKLRKKELNYTFNKDKEVILKIKEVFKTPLYQVKKPSIKKTVLKPIFIVGMPRSGTSLVEQIISSHNEVYGAGELDFLAKIVAPGLKESINNKNFFTEKAILSIREKYLKSLSSLNTSESFITDKMPLNFRFIGFILSAFPEAKIIHLNRDAMATCWSIYKHYFKSNGNGYAHNFKDLAAYYSLYKDLMVFWNDLYPNKIFDISYEDLTINQEDETRKLLKYCELDWDENCLDFHTNTRAVKTTSALQVRQKMYQGSSEAWKKYEVHLQPLLNGLTSF
tara:strand:+ start:155 stop:1819 length:1665 start_codon:yes stop_codon:yes gene_type:complete